MTLKNILTCIAVFCTFSWVTSQDQNNTKSIADSLQDKSYDYLKDQFNDNKQGNIDAAKIYAETYLRKAKLQNIDSLIQRGYFQQAYISDFENALSYCDSIISISKVNGKSNKVLLEAYYEKAYRYYNNSNYKETLEHSLRARNLAKKQGNYEIYFYSNYSIGLIKNLIGPKEEAFTTFKEQFKNFSTDSLKNQFPKLYLSSLISLGDSYTKMKKLDSASYYNHLGIKESLSFNNNENYPIFVLNEGINLFEKGAYEQSADSLSKATSLLIKNKDSSYLTFAYLNSAKLLMKSNEPDKANKLLKKADTIISRTQSLLPEYSPVYELLYENYKTTDSIENQLTYLEKLIAYNKRLNEEFEGIDLTIHKEYDTPILLESKEKIIDSLEKINKSNIRNIYILSVFVTGLIILSFYYYRKRITYKKRYDVLIHKSSSLGHKQEENEKLKTTPKIPSDILEKLLPKITEFEKNKGFLDKSISLNKMAKLMDSNSNYLSKTINHTKHKNFSSYLSDLRIEYAIQELKSNSKLLNYTIKAIAEEVGFGNTESFTKAFYAKTNLNPSYFIKQLKKEQKLTQDS